jgi:hypothetical protein
LAPKQLVAFPPNTELLNVCVGAPGHDGLRQPVKRQETLPLYHLAEELVPSVTVNAGAGPTQKNQRCWLAGVTTMAVGSPAAWLSYSSCLPFSKPSSLSLPCYTSYGSFPIGRATIISTSTTLPRTSGSPPRHGRDGVLIVEEFDKNYIFYHLY